jgi:hypothetical protein
VTTDPYQRFLDDFEHRLQLAADRRARPARRPILVTGAAVATAAAAAAIVVPPGGSHRLDVLGEAQAALAPRGQILHFVVRASYYGGTRLNTVHAATFEQWSATAPARWRVITSFPGSRTQQAWAGGRQSTLWDGRLTVRRGVKNLDPYVGPPASLGGDPIGTIRGLLARGAVREAGNASVDGRATRRLIGTVRVGRAPAEVTYDVDPTTFAPIAARFEFHDGQTNVRVRFATFERLPSTTASAKLLKIPASAVRHGRGG